MMKTGYSRFPSVFAIAEYNGEIIAAGNYGGIGQANLIARWDGSTWHPFSTGSYSGTIRDLAVYNGSLYAVGNIQQLGGAAILDIGRWDGSSWFPVCSLSLGLSQLFAAEVFTNELYIGGYFSSLNGSPMYNMAKFDGTTWSSVGGGVIGDVIKLYADTVNNRLYTCGNIVSVNGGATPCPSNVAYWDGVTWTPVGNGPALYHEAVFVFKNQLYIGTNWPTAQITNSGDSIYGIARWDGTDWKPLGKGMKYIDTNGTVYPASVHAFALLNNELVVGGGFTHAGDTAANRIASWDYTPVSLNELSNQSEKIKIIPNPFSQTAVVQIPETWQKHLPCNFKMHDSSGKTVFQTKATTLEFLISKKKLQPGLYLYKLTLGNAEIGTGKVIIE
ncbi:MAG: T9SS type A sorting domain-containing protein [Bacteroidia bacterium]|nr:T9SS type A sorting domain-containing protein [Bacteroidia bacterium]